jgi:N-acetylmuramoyl-L-alanine amidase
MKILLIAGHGQGDSGAVGNGYREADLTREVVTNVAKHLKFFTEVTIFDFDKDMYKYLKNGNKHDFNHYDYVLEVHFNALNGNAYGTEVLVHQNEQGTSVENAILYNLSRIGFTNRGIKRRTDLLVMNTVKKVYGVSHALLEVCFIDNKNDINKYMSNKQEIAKAIAEGIIDGFGLESEIKPKLLTTPNDIIWQLSQMIEINDVQGAVLALQKAKAEENPLYWILYKIVNKGK